MYPIPELFSISSASTISTCSGRSLQISPSGPHYQPQVACWPASLRPGEFQPPAYLSSLSESYERSWAQSDDIKVPKRNHNSFGALQ